MSLPPPPKPTFVNPSRPAAPPVYRPHLHVAAQLKPAPPSAYRPGDPRSSVAPARLPAPPIYRPQSTQLVQPRVVQRMEMDTNWDTKFTEFLRRDNRYAKAPAVLLTSTSDDERERGVIDASMRNFYSPNLDFKNKSTVAYDPEKHDLSGVKLVELEAEVQPNGVLVVGTHGNIHWLFGNLPGQEKKAAEKFAGKLHALEAHHAIKFTTVVLDSCWSAAELKTPTEGVPNVSPARALSAVLGPKYLVLGFNGKSAERHVSYEGHKTEAKFKNAIIFRNGEPISGSQHDSPGQGLAHSGGTLRVDKTRPHYKQLFEGQQPDLYRTNSFSNLKEFKK